MQTQTKLKNLLPFLALLICSFTAVQCFAAMIIKSPTDKRSYEYLELENGLRALVVQDPDAIKSACSLEVNVGSYDEPDDYLGLAHFLEHMLFLGTEKYPDANQYQTLIQHNGGMHNAFTAGDRTHYFFNVQSNAFEDVLMRFSEFFKSPLFNKDLVDRERHNVDSEFQMYINQDNWRLVDVNKATANPKHPFHRFNVGSLETLNQDKETLHQKVIEFYNQFYSADRMTLVMVGPDDIEKQINWVKKYFSDITKKETPPSVKKPLFDKDQLGKDIVVQAKGNARKLQIMFAMPSFMDYKAEQPLYLLSHYMGYEGEGSLYDVLKRKGWITVLMSSQDENPGSQDILQLEFSLTPEGINHIDEITQATFDWIELIRQNGFPKQFFEDIQKIHHLTFTYQEREPETLLTQDLAHRLQEHDAQNVITSRYIMPNVTFDAAKVPLNKALSYLTPENMRRLVLSPNMKGIAQTKWFKTQYQIKDLPDFKKNASNQKFDLVLPIANPFIPENVAMQADDVRLVADAPKLILEQDSVKLWHHSDKRFNEPRASVFVNFVNPMSQATAKAQMSCDLLAQLVMEKLKTTLYPAIMLGSSIQLYDHPRGITVQVFGYNDKQDGLLNALVQAFKEYKVDKNDFELIKERQIRTFKNFDQLPPFRQAAQGIKPLIVQPSWHIEELQAALESITIEDIEAFKKSFFQDLQIEMLVNGNMPLPKAKQVALEIGKQIKLSKNQSQVLPPKIYRLPSQTVNYKTLNTTDQNNALVLYVQNDAANVEAMAKTFILSKLLMTPMYQNMRVERQIGYAVGVALSLQQKVAGLLFYIQSPQYTPDKIYAALESFWEEFAPTFDTLSNEEMSNIKAAIVNELRDPPKTLREQTMAFWPTIEIGRFDFDLRDKLADAVEKTSLTEVKEYFRYLVLDKKAGKVAVVSEMKEVPKTWHKLNGWQTLKDNNQVFEF